MAGRLISPWPWGPADRAKVRMLGSPQSDTDGAFGPRDKAESSSWKERITLNLGRGGGGGVGREVYREEQKAEYVAEGFHEFKKNLFKSSLITILPDYR